MRLAALSTLFVCLASPSLADLEVRFDEGAPKDRFTITNNGPCPLGMTAVTIDLSGSPYGLIFDTTGHGAGVEVYQPFEIAVGGENIMTLPQVLDGDNRLTLDLASLDVGASVAFTIDIDDTVNAREITVSNTEIVGAKVIAKSDSGSAEGQFDETAIATVAISGCIS
ncbi:MAG: aggregation factor core [Pseudomonadota bacterium]